MNEKEMNEWKRESIQQALFLYSSPEWEVLSLAKDLKITFQTEVTKQ